MNKFERDDYEDNQPRITKKWLNKFLHSDFKQYYLTPYLNDMLYLHFQGTNIVYLLTFPRFQQNRMLR